MLIQIKKQNILYFTGKCSSIGRTMDCGSIWCRFESYLLPMLFNLIFYYIIKINNLFYNINIYLFSYLYTFSFLPMFFNRIEMIWQEGLLLDFLQKITCDLWIRKFLIHASYLFNERLVFDNIIKFFLDFIIWPMHYITIFETLNVMWVFIIILGGLMFFFNFFILLYIFII